MCMGGGGGRGDVSFLSALPIFVTKTDDSKGLFSLNAS